MKWSTEWRLASISSNAGAAMLPPGTAAELGSGLKPQATHATSALLVVQCTQHTQHDTSKGQGDLRA